MEYVQMTLNDWLDMKEQLKKELLGVQASFVRIGYTLRKIKDEKLYERDGYTSIAEFAKTEYGLNPSTVSRFMNINKRYSVDGYSDKLRPEFANLGSSKLTEMLALQESDMEMINPNTSRESIRELKDFNKTTPAAICVASVLIGGATTTKATISHVLIGTFLYQGLIIFTPPVSNHLLAGTDISDTIRQIIQNGVILYALAQAKGGSD
mgnify:CR=1 FL=1